MIARANCILLALALFAHPSVSLSPLRPAPVKAVGGGGGGGARSRTPLLGAAPCDTAESGVLAAAAANDVARGATLRGLLLSDASGAEAALGAAMGPGKAVVVFLRHLG